jgi:hypothetical protein
MSMPTIDIAGLKVSRLILGGNPFSGFSHQGPAADRAMLHYYSAESIKRDYRRAEQLGINTHIGRADHHIMRLLLEYWDEGGKIQWIAQTCPELGTSLRGVQNAVRGGASACYLHGGRMDYLLANNQLSEAVEAVAAIRRAGLPCGVAGHSSAVFDWAEDNLDVDFYMCCYYNPDDRSRSAEHIAGDPEVYSPRARDVMVERIATLSRPAIHYKIFAAGRNDPAESFAFAVRHLRPRDAVCIGVFSGAKGDMLDEDVRLFNEALQSAARAAT